LAIGEITMLRTVSSSAKRGRQTTIALLVGASLICSNAHAQAYRFGTGPTDCQQLTQPLFTEFSFYRNVQLVFQSNCAQCHLNGAGAGGLNLDPANSFGQLVNTASAQDPNFVRVVPGQAVQSLLFLKINCANPGLGESMPPGLSLISVTQQQLIRDWINAGAPLQKSGFEDR
jgi:hypothetical protein